MPNGFRDWYDWSAQNARESANAFFEGMERGERMRDRRDRRNALAMLQPQMRPGATVDNPNGRPTMAADPEGAKNAFMALGDFQAVDQIDRMMRRQQADQTRAYVQPDIDAGRYRDASMKALGAGQDDIAAQLGRMDEAQRAQVQRMSDEFAAIGYALRGKPYEERRTILAGYRPQLLARGLTAQQIDAYDPTDDNIDLMTSQAQGLAGMLSQANKDRDFRLDAYYRGAQVGDMREDNVRADRSLGEEVRHNYETESLGNRRFGLDVQAEQRQALQASRLGGTGEVMARVYDKIARGETLTEGEQRLYDDQQRRGDFGMGGFGGYGGEDYGAPVATPAPRGPQSPSATAPLPSSPPSNVPGSTRPAQNRSAPRPTAPMAAAPRRPSPAARPQSSYAGTAANPHRPRSPDEAMRLPPGSYFLDGSGQLRQRPAR